MSDITTHPVLILGSDLTLFDIGSDTFSRMGEYAKLYGAVYILVPTGDTEKKEIHSETNVHVYPAYGRTKAGQLLRVYRTALRLMAEKGMYSIISQDPFMFGFVAWLVARHKSIPFVVGIYGTDIFNKYMRTESISRRIYTRIAHFILPRATAIQTDGPETIEPLRAKYGDKVFFKPMFPANLATLRSIHRTVSTPPFKILFMGRFVPQKNIPLLLGVIESVFVKTGKNITFTIIGKGPEHEQFLKKLEQREYVSVCEIKGIVPRNEVPTLFTTHHALLMTSRYEGFPRVFMEAAVAGMPIITAEVGGIQGLVMDGMTGIVIPQDTPADIWAKRIIEFAENSKRRETYSKNIREAFERTYGGKTLLDYQRPLAEFVEQHA